jgi:hypothetical protein
VNGKKNSMANVTNALDWGKKEEQGLAVNLKIYYIEIIKKEKKKLSLIHQSRPFEHDSWLNMPRI